MTDQPIFVEDSTRSLRRSVYAILILVAVGILLGRIFAVNSVEDIKLERWRLDDAVKTKTAQLVAERRAQLAAQRQLLDQHNQYLKEIDALAPRYTEDEDRRQLMQRRNAALRQRETIRLQMLWLENSLTDEGIIRDRERLRAELYPRLRLQRPFLSANDRSRMCTIRALVEPDMRTIREIDVDGRREQRYVWYAIDTVQSESGWDTIDMVKHPLPDDPEGTWKEPAGDDLQPTPGYLYSSKPPLLPTLMAVPYWLIYNTTGYSLGTHPHGVGRVLLVCYNLVPWTVMLVLIAAMAERYGRTDWGRIFVVACACFATLLTTFAVVVNNHLPGAFCVLVAFYAAMRIWVDGRREWYYFALAGGFAAMSVACELPALAFFGVLGIALLIKNWKATLLAGVPAAMLVGAAFFATNWAAHQSFIPPYAHRSEDDNWYDYVYQRGDRVLDSYWNNRVGIDLGEPSRATYLFQSTVGHHGVFSLTPVWVLSMVGLGLWIRQSDNRRLREAAIFIAGLSLLVFVFYMLRDQVDRNYGGMTCGLRWMFWFAPMWLAAMLPAADWASKNRWLRGIAILLLGLSAVSVAYPTWNPWSHPWIYHWMHSLGIPVV